MWRPGTGSYFFFSSCHLTSWSSEWYAFIFRWSPVQISTRISTTCLKILIEFLGLSRKMPGMCPKLSCNHYLSISFMISHTNHAILQCLIWAAHTDAHSACRKLPGCTLLYVWSEVVLSCLLLCRHFTSQCCLDEVYACGGRPVCVSNWPPVYHTSKHPDGSSIKFVYEAYKGIYWVISVLVLIMDLEQEYIDIATIVRPTKDLVRWMAYKSDSDVQLLFETFL